MPSEALPEDILHLIRPQHVRNYALAKGWQRVPNMNGDVALFTHPEGTWDLLIVPMNESLDDYPKRLREVVKILVNFEARSVPEVLNDLIHCEADILRYRVASRSIGRGSIPLIEGIHLLEGAQRSLLAAACSVLNPIEHHPRLSRTEARELLAACQLGQTERGSYAISVSCPLRAVEQDQAPLPEQEPFARRAVLFLMRSLSRLVTAIEADRVSNLLDRLVNQPVLSANLCDALLEMQPAEKDSQLDVKVTLAATLKPKEPVPEIVRIKHEYFPIIEDIAKKLRPAQAPAASLFVGNVETLGGEPGPDGRMRGEATLAVMHEGQMQLVRVDLSPEDWQKAYTAMGVLGIVKLRGILHRGTRVHRITNISEFDSVQ